MGKLRTTKKKDVVLFGKFKLWWPCPVCPGTMLRVWTDGALELAECEKCDATFLAEDLL